MDSNSTAKPNFTYQKPDFESIQGEIMPLSYQAKAFPLYQLNHRDFELLIYCLYKKEIEYRQFPFSDIALMSGVRDKAQDCVLYTEGIKTGIIQCKHSENNTQLNTRQCVEEILKFIIYSINDESLVPDPINFHYYFASSSGFKSETYQYLKTFTSKITKEKNIELWTKNVISRYVGIKVEYEDIYQALTQMLKCIIVKPINTEDLQLLLTTHSTTVARRFFELKIVVDNSAVESLRTEISTFKPKPINHKDILLEFQAASVFLSTYKRHFSLFSPIEIHRKAVDQITGWIVDNISKSEENILVIKGGAGSGKSVVLSNVYKWLREQEIPTLALKADEVSGENIKALELKIGLTISLIESVTELSNADSKAIILIDQLDALSQSFSTNRNHLSTYILLIEKLKSIKNVRVIVSSRDYDLQYDPLLHPLCKNKSISVELLDDKEVKSVLEKLKIFRYGEKLLKLLSVPLHLELFCQIYSNAEGYPVLNSLYDLYGELWKLKIESVDDNVSERIKQTLYRLAVNIYEKQGGLSSNTVNYDYKSIEYLKKEGVLHQNKRNEVLFFHQTFYDYVFARQFVESKKDVYEYLDDNSHGLFIRSCLKVIVTHYRNYSPVQYNAIIRGLLERKKVRFHIKQLVLSYLGSIEEPNQIETEVFNEIVFNKPFEPIFLEAVSSSGWLTFLLRKGVIKKYLESEVLAKNNLINQVLIVNINNSQSEILRFLIAQDSIATMQNTSTRIMYFVETWDENAMLLFKKVKHILVQNVFAFCHCLENAVNSNNEWALEQILSYFLDKVELSNGGHNFSINHLENELIKHMLKVSPDKGFLICKTIISKLIRKRAWERYGEGDLIDDGAFYSFNRDDRNVDGDDEFFQIYVEEIEKNAKKKTPNFKSLFNETKESEYVSELKLLLYGLLSNAELYLNEGYEMFLYVYAKTGFEYNSKLLYVLRLLLRKMFPHLGEVQKKNIITILTQLNCKNEQYIYKDHITNKRSTVSYTGYTSYLFLTSISNENLSKYDEAWKRYQELFRKFGAITDKNPNRVTVTGSYAPYHTSSYEKMPLANWLSTFYKYNDSLVLDHFSSNGGLLQHSRAFEKQVQERADYFFPFIRKIIDDKNVSREYIVSGIEGLKNANYPSEKLLELIEKMTEFSLPSNIIMRIVWSIDYIIKNDAITKKIVDFLCHYASNHPNPSKKASGKSITTALNSVRGASFDRLVRIDKKEFSEEIFKTVESAIINENSWPVKSIIVMHSAYLLNLDKDRAFNVFQKMIYSDKRLFKDSIWSAEYFSYHYFSKMSYYFENAPKFKGIRKHLCLLLSKLYISDIKGSEEYLFELLKKFPENQSEAIDVAVHPSNLFNSDKTLNQKCCTLFYKYLNSRQESAIHKYSTSFLHFEPDTFSLIYPLLLKYSQSTAFRSSPAYFCKFLIRCCKHDNAEKILELMHSFDKLIAPDISKSSYYDNEPLNLILAIYNTIDNSIATKKMRDRCMDLFDKMLKQPQHRIAVYRAIELADI